MNDKLTIFSIIYGMGLLCYMLFIQEGLGIESEMITPYLFYYIMTPILIFSLLRVSKYVMEKTKTAHKRTEELLLEQNKQRETLINLIQIVSEKTAFITKNSEQSNQFFKEMNEAFREIAAGSNIQSESTQAINESVSEIAEQIDEIELTMDSLTTETVTTKQLSEAGEQQISALTRTIAEFRDEINEMSVEISNLITNLNETSQFSNTIKEIANQ